MITRPMIATHSTLNGSHRDDVLRLCDGNVKVNIGCGNDYFDGWINIDADPNMNPDIQMWLGEEPIPLEDNSVDSILASHILEHVPKLPELKMELARILKDNGNLIIVVPDYTSMDAWGDDTHCRAFSIHSFFGQYWPDFKDGRLTILKVTDSLGNENKWLQCHLKRGISLR